MTIKRIVYRGTTHTAVYHTQAHILSNIRATKAQHILLCNTRKPIYMLGNIRGMNEVTRSRPAGACSNQRSTHSRPAKHAAQQPVMPCRHVSLATIDFHTLCGL